MNIKEMVQNKKVKFVRYQNKELWYVTECGFEFPVPISDTGEASFVSEDKALLFMRWIRKHIENINAAKLEHSL
jgi:hypothetical protein